MEKARWMVLPALLLAGTAFAQSATGDTRMGGDRMRMTQRGMDTGVVESTDPARVAEVERKAAEIMAAQEGRRSSSGTSAQGTTSSSQPGQRERMRRDAPRKDQSGATHRRGHDATRSGGQGTAGQAR